MKNFDVYSLDKTIIKSWCKNIEDVMNSQQDLVDVLIKLDPLAIITA